MTGTCEAASAVRLLIGPRARGIEHDRVVAFQLLPGASGRRKRSRRSTLHLSQAFDMRGFRQSLRARRRRDRRHRLSRTPPSAAQRSRRRKKDRRSSRARDMRRKLLPRAFPRRPRLLARKRRAVARPWPCPWQAAACGARSRSHRGSKGGRDHASRQSRRGVASRPR